MPYKDLPEGLKELENSFESFISINPELLGKDLIDAMRNQFRAIRSSKPKFALPLPLIRVVENGHFDVKDR